MEEWWKNGGGGRGLGVEIEFVEMDRGVNGGRVNDKISEENLVRVKLGYKRIDL